MTNEEKTRLAIQRELDELRRIAQSFENLAIDAARETEELKAAFRRMDKIREEMRLDSAIDRLDHLAAIRRAK